MKNRVFVFLLSISLVGCCCGMDVSCEFDGPWVGHHKKNETVESFFASNEGKDLCNGCIFPFLMFFDIVRLERVNKRFRELAKNYKESFPLYLCLPRKMFCPDYLTIERSVDRVGRAFYNRLKKRDSCFYTVLLAGLSFLNTFIKSTGLDHQLRRLGPAFATDSFWKEIFYPYLHRVKEIVKKYNIVGFECSLESYPFRYQHDQTPFMSTHQEYRDQRFRAVDSVSVDDIRYLDEKGFQEEIAPALKKLKVFICPRLNLKTNIQKATGYKEEIYDVKCFNKELKELRVGSLILFRIDPRVIERIAERSPNLEVLSMSFHFGPARNSLKDILKFQKLKTLILYISDLSSFQEFELWEVFGRLMECLPKSVSFFAVVCEGFFFGKNKFKIFEKSLENFSRDRNITLNAKKIRRQGRFFKDIEDILDKMNLLVKQGGCIFMLGVRVDLIVYSSLPIEKIEGAMKTIDTSPCFS